MMSTISLQVDYWFTITGRGRVACFDRLPKDSGLYDPGELLHREVILDGHRYRVTGVEVTGWPGDHWTKETPYPRAFGLVVTPTGPQGPDMTQIPPQLTECNHG